MVALLVMGALLLIVGEALSAAQRSWQTTQRASAESSIRNEGQGRLRAVLSGAVLNARESFRPASAQRSKDSDLHFVCGPASELLPALPDVSGDAIFFQRRNSSGLIECSGFFVRSEDVVDLMPDGLHGRVAAQRSFRLMQWLQSAGACSLFEVDAATGASRLGAMSSRDDLYRWFREGVSQQPASLAVVADHVLAMLISTTPAHACYDTRRHQWDSDTFQAVQSRHQLPRRLTLTLLTCDARDWSKLDSSSRHELAREVPSLIEQARSAGMDARRALEHLLQRWQLRLAANTLEIEIGDRQ